MFWLVCLLVLVIRLQRPTGASEQQARIFELGAEPLSTARYYVARRCNRHLDRVVTSGYCAVCCEDGLISLACKECATCVCFQCLPEYYGYYKDKCPVCHPKSTATFRRRDTARPA